MTVGSGTPVEPPPGAPSPAPGLGRGGRRRLSPLTLILLAVIMLTALLVLAANYRAPNQREVAVAVLTGDVGIYHLLGPADYRIEAHASPKAGVAAAVPRGQVLTLRALHAGAVLMAGDALDLASGQLPADPVAVAVSLSSSALARSVAPGQQCVLFIGTKGRPLRLTGLVLSGPQSDGSLVVAVTRRDADALALMVGPNQASLEQPIS